MTQIGIYENYEVFWVDFEKLTQMNLPVKNWVCLLIANKEPSCKDFENFVRLACENNILEFKSFGVFSEKLHDWFDEIIVTLKYIELKKINPIMTTWHNKESLADAFWQCFFANCAYDSDFENLQIICSSVNSNLDYQFELKNYLERIKKGWTP